MHTSHEIIYNKPKLHIPEKRKLLRLSLHGFSEYQHHKELEHNKLLGKRAWQIRFYDKYKNVLKRLEFTNENDCIDTYIEIHYPEFNPIVLDIDPEELENILLFTTQSITTTGSSTFSVPTAWGPNSTAECISGGGGGAASNAGASPQYSGGAGGGGGYSLQQAVTGLTRGGTTNVSVGVAGDPFNSINPGDSWFRDSAYVIATAATNAVHEVKGLGGNTTGGIGTTVRKGGDGGAGIKGSTNSNCGASGGSAAGTTTAGTIGADGVNGSTTSGAGADSDTATGGAGTTVAGNVGGNGTDFDASHGAGAGGSGGGCGSSNPHIGGAGGNYGGGAGGTSKSTTPTGLGLQAVGAPGMIFLTWQAYIYTEVYSS